MNYHKYLNSAYLKEHPLCSVSTFQDALNLETSICTRIIKKREFTGSENWTLFSGNFFSGVLDSNSRESTSVVCSHLQSPSGIIIGSGSVRLKIVKSQLPNSIETTDDLKYWISEQYNSGKPFTVWYVLANSETESITVPTGFSGTVYGSLTQAGTPTPSAPVYPTGNDAEAWYDIGYHKRTASAWTDVTNVYERDNGAWTNS